MLAHVLLFLPHPSCPRGEPGVRHFTSHLELALEKSREAQRTQYPQAPHLPWTCHLWASSQMREKQSTVLLGLLFMSLLLAARSDS